MYAYYCIGWSLLKLKLTSISLHYALYYWWLMYINFIFIICGVFCVHVVWFYFVKSILEMQNEVMVNMVRNI